MRFPPSTACCSTRAARVGRVRGRAGGVPEDSERSCGVRVAMQDWRCETGMRDAQLQKTHCNYICIDRPQAAGHADLADIL